MFKAILQNGIFRGNKNGNKIRSKCYNLRIHIQRGKLHDVLESCLLAQGILSGGRLVSRIIRGWF